MDKKQHWLVLADTTELGHSSKMRKRNGMIHSVCWITARWMHCLDTLLFTKDVQRGNWPSNLELQQAPWNGMAQQNPSLVFQGICKKCLFFSGKFILQCPFVPEWFQNESNDCVKVLWDKQGKWHAQFLLMAVVPIGIAWVFLMKMLTQKILQKCTFLSTSSYTESGLLFSIDCSDIFHKHNQVSWATCSCGWGLVG